MKNKAHITACPCGSRIPYDGCCQPLHQGNTAASAEALMRSRYSAFTLHLSDYLLASWDQETRPETLDLSTDKTQWMGLQIKQHTIIDENTATVEFIARYKMNGKAGNIHELSRFRKVQQHWYYLDGKFIDSGKNHKQG